MKNKLLLLISFFAISQVYSQPINVSTTAYTVPQLVQDVLFGSQGNGCVGTVSNITWSTGTNFGDDNGIGYFTNTNPNFPLPSGLVLISGSATASVGPNNTTLSAGNWPGDNQLFDYIQNLGIDPGLNNYNDATILEFDFIPLSTTMSFDFLFASEEYGFYQCTFSDAFAFFVNDVTTGGPTYNIGLVPTTSAPVSVVTVRNSQYNTGCPSVNPTYFDKFYLLPEGLNPNTAPINFNGHTVKMTASTDVVPTHTYHIKIVIADRNDNALDSAVFLGSGSFDIGQVNGITGAVGTGFETVSDFTIANGGAICSQQSRAIQFGSSPIDGATYQWFKNGILITGATTHNFVADQPGVYSVTVTLSNGCQLTDSMFVEFLPSMPLSNPINLTSSNSIFDLTTNTSIILNGQNPTDYSIYYHNTLFDAQNIVNMIANPSSYVGTNGQIIYVSIMNDASGSDCIQVKSFILNAPLAPLNDECSGAIPLTVGSSFGEFPVNGTNFAATNNLSNNEQSCGGTATPLDVWYSFTVPESGNITIETQNNNGLTDTVIEVFSNCNTNNIIACNNNNENGLFARLSLTGLTPNQTLYARIFGYSETQGTFVVSAYDTSLASSDFENSSFNYYPNPIDDKLHLSNNQTIDSVKVYNLIGQELFSKAINAKDAILDMSNFSSGTYLIKITSKENTKNIKVVKN
ncbi:MAG: T9SS type A sorting domain-containing protein [Flavobacterium sp.]|nr:T9SS type A sorting domain-containing protein [Flavobacterium sp.]